MKLQVQGKTSKRQVRRVFGVGCFAILIAGVGGFFSLARMVREDSAKLPSDLERLRALGVPLTVDDLYKKSPTIPDSENAAKLYRRAFRATEKLPTGLLFNQHPWRASSAAEKEKARDALVAIRPILSILREATKLPHYDFDIDWGRSASVQFGFHQVPIEEGTMGYLLVYIDAEVSDRLKRGDLDGALDDLALDVQIARQSPEYGSVFGNDWRTRTQEAVLDLLWQILVKHADDGDLLDKVDQLAKRIRLPKLSNLIETDFVRGRAVIVKITSLSQSGLYENMPAGFRKGIDNVFNSPGVKEAFEAKYVNTYLRLFNALSIDSEDWTGIHKAIVRINEQLEKDGSLDNLLAKKFAPEYNEIPGQYAQALAKQRMLLLSIELIRRRKTTGRFPDALPQMGLVSIDPATERPFNYEREPFGFTLVSELHRFFPGNANSKTQSASKLFDIRHTFSERASSSAPRQRS